MDYMNPDYTEIFKRRQLRLDQVRSNPQLLAAMKVHYRENPEAFINDWGMTFDPRQIEKGLLATVPFIMWPKQEEYIRWVLDRWKAGEYGVAEKSRDCGVTWPGHHGRRERGRQVRAGGGGPLPRRRQPIGPADRRAAG